MLNSVTDMPVMCAPACYTADVDVNGSHSISVYTAPMKFVQQASRGRQLLHSTFTEMTGCLQWHVSRGTQVSFYYHHHHFTFATFSSSLSIIYDCEACLIALISPTHTLLARTFFATHLIAAHLVTMFKFPSYY